MFDVDERHLDESSLKIRSLAGSAEQLFADPVWRMFLFHAANKISLSSAMLECMFAAFRQWLRSSPKPLSLANLQARSVPVAASAPNDSIVKKTVTNSRPEWVLNKGESRQGSAPNEHLGRHWAARATNDSTRKEAISAASESYSAVSARAKAEANVKALSLIHI